jgi:hypothetical protein
MEKDISFLHLYLEVAHFTSTLLGRTYGESSHIDDLSSSTLLETVMSSGQPTCLFVTLDITARI